MSLSFFIDAEPPRADFLGDVIHGLSQSQKTLSPKYFYDEEGSRLFDQICTLEEYYPTRTELALLATLGPHLAEFVKPGSTVIEFGSGSSVKIRTLLTILPRPRGYVAIDISRDHLQRAAQAIADDFPDLLVGAACADFTRPLALPDTFSSEQRLGFFPGSTIGNFTPSEAVAFLKTVKNILGPDGLLLIGVDLKKDEALLNAAYNDSRGITAAFNKNILSRMKKELGADLDIDGFAHHAAYNREQGRIEMHLRSLRTQSIFIGAHEFPFSAHETIHTENSYKYSLEEFTALAAQAGMASAATWRDDQHLFSIHLLRMTP